MSHTARQAMTEARAELAKAGIDGAARDVRVLMAAALDIGTDRLTLQAEEPLLPAQMARFQAFVTQRQSHMPVARILARRMFWGRDFSVTPDVLDPRPETETLIAAALQVGPFEQILDLGTGSGIIAVTLLAEWKNATATATDLSSAALSVAQINAASAGVDARFQALQSDWYANVIGSFDLIVSNPPYIAAAEMPDLAPEVRLFDPQIALSDGADGLSAYRAIAKGLPQHLKPGGLVLLEIGPTQAQAVSDLLRSIGAVDIAVHPDLDGRDRMVSARMSGEKPA